MHAPYYIVICSFLALQHFSILPLNSMIFGVKVNEHKTCFYFLYKFGWKHFSF